MTNEELRRAFEHHCLSNRPSLLCEPLKWWKARKIKKEAIREAGVETGLSDPPSFFFHPFAWYRWWFLPVEGLKISNFTSHLFYWKWDVIDAWHRYRMTPESEKPQNPIYVLMAEEILRDLQNLEEEKNIQGEQDKKDAQDPK